MPSGVWHSDSESRGFHTIGRLLSHKPYHVEALKTILHSSLNPVKGMEITFLEHDRFLLKFSHNLDRKHVLASGPWAFEKNLIVLAAVAENENPAEVDLAWCDFHVRIHGLLIGKMTSNIALFIGSRIGRLTEFNQQKGSESWGSFMRIRLAIDVSKPLPRALKIRTVLGDEHLVTFTYERLPNFCYVCGRIGHIFKWCEQRFQAGFEDPGKNAPYGPWLRALPRTDARTRFPHNRGNPIHPQVTRPSFTPLHNPVTATKRGSAVFGDFSPSDPGPVDVHPAPAPEPPTLDHTPILVPGSSVLSPSTSPSPAISSSPLDTTITPPLQPVTVHPVPPPISRTATSLPFPSQSSPMPIPEIPIDVLHPTPPIPIPRPAPAAPATLLIPPIECPTNTLASTTLISVPPHT
ncbi:hypothetical protein Sango_2054500 [Sesamum angolense]|uniref:CCHC-type domain-containing protein n=1 Tax=Sesamum angolense TaxID=2727404 RepID=A0AAE1WG63_9LAMI|nr:hypothetical protein Sango_2054500 [Sesamum angolense]